MYHCHIQFYCAGGPCRAFEILKGIAPLAGFTHDFSEIPAPALAAGADVVFACLPETGAASVCAGPGLDSAIFREKRLKREDVLPLPVARAVGGPV